VSITLDGINLPDLVKEDEFAFTGIEAVVEISLSGAPIVWERTVAGKPIDLVGGPDNAWLNRATLISLRDRAGVAGAIYALNYEGEITDVRFRNEDVPAIEATPVKPSPEMEDNDNYNNVRIKLMKI
jgi:hypothetical protein